MNSVSLDTLVFRDDEKLELQLEFTKLLDSSFYVKSEGRYVEKSFVAHSGRTDDFEICGEHKVWGRSKKAGLLWQKVEAKSTKVSIRFLMSERYGCKQNSITPFRGEFWPKLDFQIKVPSTGLVKLQSPCIIDLST